MNGNTVGLVVIGVVGVIALLLVGRGMTDSHRCPPPVIRDVDVRPQKPQNHGKKDFWMGYRDGYTGRWNPNGLSDDYVRGYRIGADDRKKGCHDYFDKNCPPDFRLQTPGFRLDID